MARKTYGNGLWPAPTYVATYADGSKARMSFWTHKKKPIDCVAAYEQARHHKPIKIAGDSQHPFGIPTGSYVKMISFYVEHMGQWIGGDRLEQVA